MFVTLKRICMEPPTQINIRNEMSRLRRLQKSIRDWWQIYLLILPALVFIVIFSYIPMYGLQIAFKDYKFSLGIGGSEWVGLKHFVRFLNNPDFPRMLKNTLTLTLYSLCTFPLNVIMALALNEVRSTHYKKTVQMVTYMPHFLSTVVLCSIVLLMLDKNNGPINHLLAALGLERQAFITQPAAFPHIYVWSGIWQELGWSSIIYIAALASVSPDLIDAAKIDGATRMQVIRHVNIPTILPTIIISFILSTSSLLSIGFEKIYLLQNSLNLDASTVFATYTYQIGIEGNQFSYSTAIGLFSTVANVIILLIANAVCKRVSDIGIW